MKNMPKSPPLLAKVSEPLTHFEGSVISKAPKKLIAKITKRKKNAKLNHGLVANAFKASPPNKTVTRIPRAT